MRNAGPVVARVGPKATPTGMNKTESAYALVLEAKKRAGEVRDYWFEGLTLRLGEGARFTADFFVVLVDGTCELHEVKGFMREAALVRLNVAARMYPFRIRLIKKTGPMAFTSTEIAP